MTIKSWKRSSILNDVKYQSLMAGNYSLSGTFNSIATQTVGAGGAASITFSSIPSTFTHLQIRATLKTSVTGNIESLFLNFNGDATPANYYSHWMYGNGTTSGSTSLASSYLFAYGVNAANTSTTNMFGFSVIDILDYKNINKFKTIRSTSGHDTNGTGVVSMNSQLWNGTSAINSIVINGNGGLLQYSSFALYGVN